MRENGSIRAADVDRMFDIREASQETNSSFQSVSESTGLRKEATMASPASRFFPIMMM